MSAARKPVPNTDHPGPGCWWWLSFADGDLPKGSQFLGVAVVQARDIPAAVKEAWRLGINPGGEVQACALTQLVPKAEWRERLLSRDECTLAQCNPEPAELSA